MISVKEALAIHAIIIEDFGGTKGIRDVTLLESAINRPYQTFDGKELYSSPVEKAAALLESIVQNHPFIDGNKRTGYVLARLTLMDAHFDLVASEEEKYQLVIDVSIGRLDFTAVKNWLDVHVRK